MSYIPSVTSARGTSRCARFWSLLLGVVAAGLMLAPASALAGFGLTSDSNYYTVDTGAGLVFKVRRTDPPNNQQSMGDISSLVYNGVEYQDQVRGSQVGTGLSGGTVTADTDNATYIRITVTATDGNVTHYYIARNGYPYIYMGTYFTSEPSVGNVRFITRIPFNLLPNGPTPSNINGNIGAIESGDIFGLPDGESRSKHYSNHRQMDWTYTGATGTNVGVWMVKNNTEGMSGGPFYRSLINQGAADQEIYELINYGESQTEAYRMSVLNLYTLVFTNGSAPDAVDTSWMEPLNLIGWVPAASRGGVTGSATGVPAAFQAVVGFANSTAQYWATVNNGTYTCSGMIPGTYTATLYKGELAVATDTVTITSGATASLNLASTETVGSRIFQIGEWDGTPAGFLNADKMTTMHPTDVRMDSWATTTYTVGVDSPASFPAIQARAANSPYVIKFNLAPNQIADLRLKIGITVAYNGGRPQVVVNNSYTTPAEAASNQPSTRSYTVGTYRGNNTTFAFTIPASALVVGTNTFSITPISGTADLSTWLSAGWVYDAVELDGPIATPVITYVGGKPLTIAGTSEPGRNLTLYDGTTVLGTTTAAANGTWTFAVATTLANASHSLTAIADDGYGHSSPASAAYVFDSTVTMPAIVSALGDTGTYSSGATTSDRVFVFNGTAAAGAKVTLTQIGVGTMGTVVANGTGAWSFNYTGVSLPDGANSFYATASNGTASSASSPIFTLNCSGTPRVAITRYNPVTNVVSVGVSSVVYQVTFNQTVSNVSTAAFSIATTGTATGAISGVSASTGTVFYVTVGNLSGTGDLHLNLNAGVVLDPSNTPEAGFTAGQVYSLVLPTIGNGTWVQPASGGLWSDPTNWNNAVIADGGYSGNFATLDLTANNTVHLDSPRTVNSLTFGDTATTTAASWTIDNNGNAANTLTLSGTSPTVTVNTLGTGAVTTIAATVAGTNGLAKAGSGTLMLAAANTVTGTLNLNAGNLQVASGGGLALGNGAINTATGCVLDVAGGSVSTSGLVSTASSFVVDSGSANLGSYRTNSTFGALLKVNGGTLNVGDVNLQRTSGTTADFTTGLVITGGAATTTTLRVGTLNSYAAVSVEGGSLTATGTVTLGNQTTGARGGALRVINNGVFNATDTALGVLMCRNPGSNPSNVATATFTGGVSTVEKFTLGYDATVTGGSATITVNGGTLYLGSGGIVKNGASTFATALNFSSGTVGAKANWATALPIAIPSGNIAFKAADANGNPFAITLTGVVSGAGALTKTGAGTLTLDGGATHTYSGATTVNGGALRVTSGLSSGTSAVTVNNTGVLAGNGTINRPIVLNSGGAIAPDGTTAIATLTGTSLTWNGGGALSFDLGASGVSDVLALSGAFAKGSAGTYTINLNPGSGFAVGNTYTLVTFASTTFTDAGAFTATGLPTGAGALFQLSSNSLTVRIQGLPTLTSATSVAGVYGTALSYTATVSDTPATLSVDVLPPGLTFDPASGVISGTPTAAGNYDVTLTATNTAGSASTVVSFAIAKAPATVTLTNLATMYSGNAQSVAAVTSPPNLAVAVTYNGSATLPVNAGTYAVAATITDPNYAGSASGTFVINKATPTVSVTPYSVTYDGNAHTATGAATGVKGESLAGLDLSGTTHTNAGSYTDTWQFADPTGNYLGASGVVADKIAKASATITLGALSPFYDGTPKAVTTETVPAGLTVDVTYGGTDSAPVLPGSYAVTATIDDPNYTGTTSGTLTIGITALVGHATALDGELDGSIQVLSADNLTLNGSAGVTGDLLVPGTPAVVVNGTPTFAGTRDANGNTDPANYNVTLNGDALLRYVVRRVDPIALPSVAQPPASLGTRDVVLNKAGQVAGDFSTVRDLTLNGGAGVVVVPAGTYRYFTANGSNAFVLGTAGATSPSTYNFQTLTLNGSAQLQVVGPVVVTLANGVTFSTTVGTSAHPDWLVLQVANGGVTLNGSADISGTIVAPSGTVTLNGGSTLRGSLSADRLTTNGGSTILTAP